ncbi:MAG: phosphoribosylformylglycinamidine synthase subunit PurQ [Gemmatimonadetes bacterium]|nr:phosphoribosylformylglycinamidine synthase subunit PurQ [Gemmatimonadota bacterium]
MRIAVITFPGSNCDQDCHRSVEAAGATAVPVWHREISLGGTDAVIVPGGFAHGDYLRPGAIARFSPIMTPVVEFARAGRLVVGICNGFQILCEAGLLPGALLRNRSLRFQSHDCALRVERSDTPFTSRYREGQVIRMPLAHADGNYYADRGALEELESEGRVLFRYSDAEGESTEEANPNGSLNRIAGIVNEGGNVLGLMPHPDRAIDLALGSQDGLPLFESLVDSVHQRTPAQMAAAEGRALAGTAR